jgi:hypothetical protein
MLPGMSDFYEKAQIRTDRGLFIDKGNRVVDVRHPDFAGGAKFDGVKDDTAAIQAALDFCASELGGGTVLCPEGTSPLASGSSITLKNDVAIIGAGRQKTFITSHNAYAFAAPSTSSLDRVGIAGFSFQLRSGSTSGGAVEALSDSYHSEWQIRDCYGDGVSGCADPVFNLDGFINSHVYNTQAQACQIGIKLGTVGFSSNASTLLNCRVSTASVAGILLSGGGGNRVLYSTIENNTGYGVKIDGCTMPLVEGNWFENQGNTDIYITGGSSQTRILYNKIHYHQSGSKPHIEMVGPANPAALYGMQIVGNMFQDVSGNGYDVQIDANCAGTHLQNNKWYTTGTVQDLGTGTSYIGNRTNDDYPVTSPNRIGGPWEAAYQPYYDTQYAGPFWGRRRASQTTDLLLIETEAGTDLFKVDYTGRLISPAMPTANPGGSGIIWSDGGTLKIT